MRFNEHILNEDEKTEFYETASMLGIVCSDGLAKRCRDIIYDYKNTDLKTIESALKECQALVGSGGYDWSPQGVKSVKAVKMGKPRVLHIFALLSGMFDFRYEIVQSIVGGSKLYFIHNRIEDWYELEKKVVGSIKGSKANTADAIISTAKVDKTLKALEEGPIQADDAEQSISLGSGVTVFQVSLKKKEDEAQLGKITSFLKKNLGYGVDTAAAANMIVSSKEYDYVELLNDILITEGFFDKAKNIAKSVWKKATSVIKSLVSKFNRKWLSMFKKPLPKNYVNDFLAGGALSEKEMTKQTEMMVEKIAKNPSKAVNMINNEIKKLENLCMMNESIYFKKSLLTPMKKFKGNPNSGSFTLTSNYCTVRTLIDMVSDQRDLGATVNRLVAEMLFGNTKLPLWKVFGDYGDGNSYVFLGSMETWMEKTRAKTNVETLGINIKPQKDFYTITIGMLEKIDETGKEYVLLRTGTNSSSSFTFIFEGTATKHISLDEGVSKVVG